MPMPIPQHGFSWNAGIKSDTHPNTPQNVHLKNEDDHLSSSRSRRLVSGYRFGNPPSPTRTRPSSPLYPTQQSTTPPSRNDDSPALTDASPSQDIHLPNQSIDVANQGVMAKIYNDGAVQRLRSSKSRDRETGYDALNGLNDGEADLDESAPPAAFGTEAFMRGEPGEAGEYHFPRHRLRKTMKGKLAWSRHPIGTRLRLCVSDESKIPLVIGEPG